MATKFLRHSDELYHYGVKGMKWGKSLFGDRIYTQKKKLKYDNNEIWRQDTEALESARDGMEKMREEQRKESERRKRRKLASAVSRNSQYYNKR